MAQRSSIEVDTRELRSYIKRVARRERNFRPLWGQLFDELADAHVRNFQTDGGAVGGWAPLKRRYFNEKFAQGYGKSTLVREGTLKDALSRFRGRGSETAMHPTNAFWGIDVSKGSPISYAKFHQMGTRNMHERQIVFVPKNFAAKAGDMAAEHVIEDGGLRGVRSKARGVFNL
tara:strand:+ start:100 stop:621 length:522 start_codon:yes stop_codon:yes gene_type:complete